MNTRIPLSIGALLGGSLLLSFSVFLIQSHFQSLKDVREYGLPLAAEIPPLQRRASLLKQQGELSALEAGLRNDSAEEKFRVYVVPQGGDVKRLLAFMQSARTFLERRKLVRSMSAIDVGEPGPMEGNLQAQSIHFTAQMRPEGRAQLFSILNLSGMLTVGDVLSPEHIKTLFSLTESENYAGIVPVERFLSADLLGYVRDSKIADERLAQALASDEFLKSFKGLLQSSELPQVREFLTGDLGRALVAQKLWPVQFMTVEKEHLEELADGWEEVELTLKAYSRE